MCDWTFHFPLNSHVSRASSEGPVRIKCSVSRANCGSTVTLTIILINSDHMSHAISGLGITKTGMDICYYS